MKTEMKEAQGWIIIGLLMAILISLGQSRQKIGSIRDDIWAIKMQESRR